MCKLRDNNNNGFTLLEILIAIVLLCIGLLAMASLTVGIMGGNLFSNQLTVATTLAQDQMEDMRRVGYSGLSSSTEDYGDIEDYAEFKRETATDVGNPATGMTLVTITVFWDSDDHSVALKTIIAE
jgi:type IV pilus assembly protein PilV